MKRLILVLIIFSFYNSRAQERPNILWLVCEDMSPYLRSYGNTLVNTPNLDKLAAQGIRYTQAHANGTQCSPSRSTLIAGRYAISLGTDIHREGRPVPDAFYFPIYLRQAGYYCTNFNKEDYNNKKTPDNVWDESAPRATYARRKDKSQPFFAVFNTSITHMNRITESPLDSRSPRTVAMKDVSVPAYVPDLPEVRNDIAWNMDAVMLMDQWVGKQLADLKSSGEADNTIIFFYADHGGTVPRGKGHVYESGVRVPLIVYFPEKWRHLAATPVPAVTDRLVSFVDFPATIFNITGVKKPDFMIGKPFLGVGANRPENINQHILNFRSNMSISFAPARAINNGKYKLIWNYQSAYPNGARQNYQWGMPAHQAWDVANSEGSLTPLQKKFWLPVETFELYDLEKDSLETRNLISDKAYNKIAEALKRVLQSEIREQKDLGFIPREYRIELQKQGPLYDVVRKNNIDINKQIAAAETASLRDVSNLQTLRDCLSDKDPVVQYWGSSGICGLAKVGLISSIPKEANAILDNPRVIPEVKCMLAEAMVYAGNKTQGLAWLLQELQSGFMPAAASLQNVGDKAKPIAADLAVILKQDEKAIRKLRFYIRSTLVNCGELPYTALVEP